MLVELLHFIPGVVSVFGREVRGQGKRNERISVEKGGAQGCPGCAVEPRLARWARGQSNAGAVEELLLPPPHTHIATGFPTAR